MAPPSYADLGKSAKDLFSKGYTHGVLKLDLTNKTGDSKEYEFKSTATHDLATESLGSTFDVKYKLPQYGATITEKWNSKNVLTSQVEVNDQLAKGLKVTLETAYGLKDGHRTANVKTEFVKPSLKFNSNLSVLNAPLLDSSLVLEQRDILFGLQSIVDIAGSKVRSTNVTVAKITPQFSLTGYVNNGTVFGASLFHRAHQHLDIGVQTTWKSGDANYNYALACKYEVSSDLTARAKINNASEVALSATHKLSRELAVTATSDFSLLSAKAGAHKFGFGIEYSA
uniref:Voltage-dependent anion-selective channel protein 1 n=1 Tax=Rhabditophanes sp. KR3021 TaxID=114890 RepID=A0AC35TUJ3_9BILA